MDHSRHDARGARRGLVSLAGVPGLVVHIARRFWSPCRIAIARAVHFGAEVLILDEPTSALGVHQTSTVLRYIDQVRAKGLSVIFITHDVHHALAVGDRFTVLNRGRTIGSWDGSTVDRDKLEEAMAGGRALNFLGQRAAS